jgi:lysophospholipid acyltransferase (LPLAT)-like uncharacterized protein
MALSTDAKLSNNKTNDSVARAYSFASLADYSLKDRFIIKAADLAFFVLIRLICLTIRWQVAGEEHFASISRTGHLPIYTFWHNRIFLGTYFFRNRRIVVMTSRSKDGEYIARFIQRFGYGAVRGSSTRGAVGALVEMVKLMRAGCPAGFSIDGPKGPKYVAKMGAVLLSKKTGNPVLPFSLTPAKRWEINSWDKLQIPMPFTKALVEFSAPIYVAKDADEKMLETKQKELQWALDDVTARGEEWRKHRSANVSPGD